MHSSKECKIQNGVFKINGLKIGDISITISRLGRETKKLIYNVTNGVNTIDVLMGKEIYNLDQIVVTGTKTFKRKTKSCCYSKCFR